MTDDIETLRLEISRLQRERDEFHEDNEVLRLRVERLRAALEYYADKFGGDTASKALRDAVETPAVQRGTLEVPHLIDNTGDCLPVCWCKSENGSEL